MSEPLINILILSLVAGLAMPLGALIARFESIRTDWLETELRHTIIAFGAGALLAAVALVLVPEGMHHLTPLPMISLLLLGGITFLLLDYFIARSQGRYSQLIAMLADFIPEALALGATFSASPQLGTLLAGIIALQNCPEGFNAYRELLETKRYRQTQVILLFTAMAFLGPIAGLTGHLFLSDAPIIIAAIMTFAAGGILYLIFQDIAPNVKLNNRWTPALGAVIGFALGVFGKYLTGH